ncbi:Tetratricopeptide repeat [Phytophthora cinnamomi]|uniref:Tetratricopeptide repeat n=1 Tax=Phytophthora cinnamomi TaxID=4785 RepID=UPI00355A7F12|nr:Tetratricopeptide repeat [Phytophthora cinnamomi]
MPLMPGSPRPGTPAPQEEDDGVYRSLFQQPVVDIPPAAPSYAWFEFLLHPEALQKHLATLRRQRKRDVHSATSAIELVREFLDQAQLVADEGNVRNKRYSALLLVAAQVALQMQLPLAAIEAALPLHFQRLLLDGIVDFAEQPRGEFTRDVEIQPYVAHVLHNRWTLRALVNQSQSGYLTCSSRGEGEEVSSTYQMALGDLMASHLQIAQNIQAILMNDEKQKLSPQTQVETYFDLGVYFFSFNGFEKAYSCFSRASELVEDGENGDESMEEGGNVKLPADDRANLEGYLAACEAVLEVQSVNESPAVLKTPKMQIEMAWEGRDWDKVIQLLENDIVASDLMRLPQGYRAALEQQALRLLRSSSNNLMEDDPHVAAPTVRFFYKRIVVENAVNVLLLEGDQEEATSLETCVSVCIRQLQDEIFHSVAREASDDGEAKKRFVVLRLASASDPRSALKGYLVAASLATNFFSDMVSVVDIIDQSSLVRLSQCLVKVGAHVAAAVLYQCFMPEEFKYGLRILRLGPESHDDAFFQYFWELPFLELLVDLHSSPKYLNERHVTLLTSLIQSPELNSSNPAPVVKDAEQRILRCYFRDLCRIYLGN